MKLPQSLYKDVDQKIELYNYLSIIENNRTRPYLISELPTYLIAYHENMGKWFCQFRISFVCIDQNRIFFTFYLYLLTLILNKTYQFWTQDIYVQD